MRLFTLTRRDVHGFMTAGFWGILGLAGVAFGSLMPGPFEDRLPILLGALFTVVVGTVIALLRARLPQAFHVGSLGFAIVAMTAMVSMGPTIESQAAMTALFTCVACHAALILRWQGAVATIVAAECALVLLAITQPELPFWITIPAGTSMALIGGATAGLRMVARQAAIDPLTGIRNRRGFDREVHHWMAVSSASDQPLSLILLDLDRFKAINDDLGHAFGDRILREVAERWKHEIAGFGILGRYGGDEFAVLLPGVSERGALQISERLREAVNQECSAGITSLRKGDSLSLFIGRADIGLYRSKNSGRGRTTVESAQGSVLVESIRTAIDEHELDVHLQPIVRISEGERIVAMEALVRWPDRPDLALTPEGLVRTAEEHGLISGLGELVLELACENGHVLSRQLGADLSITVNISGLELVDPRYSARVIELLQRTGWPADRLILEITERDLEADSADAIWQLVRLRAQGIRIAIDDFGKGYSSLTRIASIPCDILKVDREVIADTAGVHQLLDAITAIGSAFDLEVIVEGIETVEQAHSIAMHGIDLAQGYLYSPPKPVAEFVS